MLFKTLSKDNTETEIKIIGARSKNSNQATSSVVFGNYDDDSKLTYSLAEISTHDHFGTSDSNGYGDLLFKTNASGVVNSELPTQMIINYMGYVGVGTLNPSERLHVVGNIRASNLYVENIFASNQAPGGTTCNVNNYYTLGSNASNLEVVTLTASNVTSSNVTIRTGIYFSSNNTVTSSIVNSNGQIAFSNAIMNTIIDISKHHRSPVTSSTTWTLIGSWAHSYDVHRNIDYVGVSTYQQGAKASNDAPYVVRILDTSTASVLGTSMTLSNNNPMYTQIAITTQPYPVQLNTSIVSILGASMTLSNINPEQSAITTTQLELQVKFSNASSNQSRRVLVSSAHARTTTRQTVL